MINMFEVNETNKMIEQENLDVRTITLGISLLDCIDSDLEKVNQKVYNKITGLAKNLVQTGEDISKEYGIPIVNKRISVTPIALIGGAADVYKRQALYSSGKDPSGLYGRKTAGEIPGGTGVSEGKHYGTIR